MKKCKWCGKEFEPKNYNQVYCSERCNNTVNNLRSRIKSKIKRISKKFNFEVKNVNKIINAKLMIFKNSNPYRCPCDASNPERYCGSAQCIADTLYQGHCHCNLFHKRNIEKQKIDIIV